MNKKRLFKAVLGLCGLAASCVSSQGASINFEDRAAGPSNFGGPPQTLVYNTLAGDPGLSVTISGGVILTNETNQSTDNSNVYATSTFGLSLLNPITLTFNKAITNFQLDILNAYAGNYTLADNAGQSMNFSLASQGGSIATEGFAAAGSIITITYNGPTLGYDFAIDNLLFDQAVPTVGGTPEPGTWITLLTGLGAIAAFAGVGKIRRVRTAEACN